MKTKESRRMSVNAPKRQRARSEIVLFAHFWPKTLSRFVTVDPSESAPKKKKRATGHGHNLWFIQLSWTIYIHFIKFKAVVWFKLQFVKEILCICSERWLIVCSVEPVTRPSLAAPSDGAAHVTQPNCTQLANTLPHHHWARRMSALLVWTKSPAQYERSSTHSNATFMARKTHTNEILWALYRRSFGCSDCKWNATEGKIIILYLRLIIIIIICIDRPFHSPTFDPFDMLSGRIASTVARRWEYFNLEVVMCCVAPNIHTHRNQIMCSNACDAAI